MPPTLANGKVCYVEIPADDIQHSADVYSILRAELEDPLHDRPLRLRTPASA